MRPRPGTLRAGTRMQCHWVSCIPIEPCTPDVIATESDSYVFGTNRQYCLKIASPVNGWGCNDFDGRTVYVNMTDPGCGAMPLPEPDWYYGGYLFQGQPRVI